MTTTDRDGAYASSVWALLRRDRLVVLTMLCCGPLAALWYVGYLVRPVGPILVGWTPALWAALFITSSCWTTSRSLELPQTTRRFWRQIATAGAILTVGLAARAIRQLDNPAPDQPGIWEIALFLLTCLMIFWALIRLPLGLHTARHRLTFFLDIGTVVAAAAVFAWYLVLKFEFHRTDQTRLASVAGVIAVAVGLAAVFALTKVTLTGGATVDVQALRLLGLAVICCVLGSLPEGLGQRGPGTSLVAVAATGPLAAAAARVQRARGQLAQGASRRGGRRPYSILPYVAVAATCGLLGFATVHGSLQDRVIVAVAVVLVVLLVVVRQLLAFEDNNRLLVEQREYQHLLTHQANHDALTELANRSLFQSSLVTALSGDSEEPAVLLLDLNGFKAVNDMLGHAAGDRLLIEVAGRLAGCVRDDDLVARLGGDEFAILLRRAEVDAVAGVLERIGSAVTQPIQVQDQLLSVGASIGVAYGMVGASHDELLRRADVAMYEAKANRLGPVVRHQFYTPELDSQLMSRRRMEDELREAIEQGQLYLLYQPIVTLQERRPVAVEALVRWNHPRRGPVSPADIIPLAESTGLIVPLGRWLLAEACQQAADWLAAYGKQAPSVSVNVSAQQLQAPGFAGDVITTLAETGLPAERLTLEITESVALQPGASVDAVTTLRAIGVRISLDDFGTAQSCLELLQSCPVDELKLDRSFTATVQNAGQDRIALALHKITDALSLNAVAEGVETEHQARRLAELGYRLGQGYLFSPPAPPAQIAELIDASMMTALPG